MSGRKDWNVIRWEHAKADPMHGVRGFTIDLMVSPFYDGEKYAVRRGSRCLNTSGEWEREPMPSSRDAAFYARCRFDSFDAAADAAEAAIAEVYESCKTPLPEGAETPPAHAGGSQDHDSRPPTPDSPLPDSPLATPHSPAPEVRP